VIGVVEHHLSSAHSFRDLNVIRWGLLQSKYQLWYRTILLRITQFLKWLKSWDLVLCLWISLLYNRNGSLLVYYSGPYYIISDLFSFYVQPTSRMPSQSSDQDSTSWSKVNLKWIISVSRSTTRVEEAAVLTLLLLVVWVFLRIFFVDVTFGRVKVDPFF